MLWNTFNIKLLQKISGEENNSVSKRGRWKIETLKAF